MNVSAKWRSAFATSYERNRSGCLAIRQRSVPPIGASEATLIRNMRLQSRWRTASKPDRCFHIRCPHFNRVRGSNADAVTEMCTGCLWNDRAKSLVVLSQNVKRTTHETYDDCFSFNSDARFNARICSRRRRRWCGRRGWGRGWGSRRHGRWKLHGREFRNHGIEREHHERKWKHRWIG
jgi:hypothetical protein